jgi:integrase
MDVAILSTSRPGEFRKVKWSDIDDSGSHYKEPHLYLRLTKNGTTHKVYLPLYIREQLRSLPRYAHGYVFSIDPRGPFDLHWFNKELTNRCELVGIHKKITGKSLRGTGASMYLKKHKLQEVAKITNHKDINILYKHYYDEDEEIIENMIENNDIVPKVITAKDIIESFADWSKPFKTTIYYPAIKEAEAAIMTKLRVKSNKNDTNGSKNHISALNPA